MKTVNAANVLVALRDHIANDVDSLTRQFTSEELVPVIPPDLAPPPDVAALYASYEVRDVLRQLLDAGLIVCEDADNFDGHIDATPNLRRVQSVLGFSLRELGESRKDHGEPARSFPFKFPRA